MNKREFSRKSRMEKLKATISQSECSYNKLIALLMVEEGLSRRTAREDIDALINLGFCVKEGDNITLTEKIAQNG